MRFTIILLAGLFTFPSLQAQTPQKDLPLLLVPGQHMATIINYQYMLPPPEDTKLLMKAAKGMQQNSKWFLDTFVNTLDSTLLPEKYGLTKEEYAAFQRLSQPRQDFKWVVGGTDTLTITTNGKWVSLSGKGRLAAFDSLRVDLQQNTMVYKGKKLMYKKAVNLQADAKNPFQSTFNGYLYAFKDMGQTEDFTRMSSLEFSVSVGKLENGKVALQLLHSEMKEGKMAKFVALPVVLD